MKHTIWLALVLAGCKVNETDAKRILKQEGVTSYELGGFGFCGRGDLTSREFWGWKNGETVTGTICGGSGGYVVRYK